MRGVLVAAAVWLAAGSLAGHPALAGAGEGTGARCASSAHEGCWATPSQCGPGAIRSARCERRAAGPGQAVLFSVSAGVRAADIDGLLDAPRGALPVRASLVSSVTRAPRAPPRF